MFVQNRVYSLVFKNVGKEVHIADLPPAGIALKPNSSVDLDTPFVFFQLPFIFDFNLKPKSVYGVTKLTQEQLITTGSKIPYTILRYQNVYGAGQSLNNPYTGIISIFSNIFNKGGEVTLFDNGVPSRDFIYVDDVVEATYLCINEKGNYKTYNVGIGNSLTIQEVTEKLKNLINKDCNIKISDYHRDGDVMHAKANIKKIKKDLNWKPKIDIDNGLDRFTKWFKKEII